MHTFWFKDLTQQQFITTVERKFSKQTAVLHQALIKYDVAVRAHLLMFVVHSTNCCLTVPVLSFEGTVTSKFELREAVHRDDHSQYIKWKNHRLEERSAK